MGVGAVHTASTQTLLSHLAFGILPVTILEHRSVSGYSEAASLPCWDSSYLLNAAYSPNIPIRSEFFLGEPMHKICIQVEGKDRVLPKLVYEVVII